MKYIPHPIAAIAVGAPLLSGCSDGLAADRSREGQTDGNWLVIYAEKWNMEVME